MPALRAGALDVLQLEGIRVPRSRPRSPARRSARRCAFVEGFSLHADTWLHENDVVGLEQLCNYGAHGPVSLERLSALPDGRLAYRLKRASPTGETHLVLAPVAFLRPGGHARPAPRANPRPLRRFPLPRPPPRPSSASGECRPTFETRPGLTTAPGLLYPPTGHHLRRALSGSLVLPPPARRLGSPARASATKAPFVLPWTSEFLQPRSRGLRRAGSRMEDPHPPCSAQWNGPGESSAALQPAVAYGMQLTVSPASKRRFHGVLC